MNVNKKPEHEHNNKKNNLGSTFYHFAWLPSVEIIAVMVEAENQSVPWCICYCKTCGVDTSYSPLLPQPPIQTWQAALVHLTHHRAVSFTAAAQCYQLCPGCQVVDCERGKQVLRGPQDGNVSLVKWGGSFSAQHTALMFTLIRLQWMVGRNGKLKWP